MLIYNSLTGKKEDLKKTGKHKLNMFVCGPTVYNYAHIGHARTYINFDFIKRYLENIGYKIFYLQNITDIDDKIIRRAAELKISSKKLARQFEKSYYRDMKNLNVNAVDKYARATKYISQIVKQIQILIKKGQAYKIENDGYYFDLSTFPEYGRLSKRTIVQAEDAVSRIDESANKKNLGDFCLWKFSKAGEPFWPTSLGKGRPGWHIEDTAITEYYFGAQYDIHGGAIDLKFPHHEAEIAQQESISGKKPMVKIWMHTGFLLVNNSKMSKSLGNFITIKDFLEKYSPNVLRYLIFSHHYRSPINYTEDLIKQIKNALFALNQFYAKLNFLFLKNNKNTNLRICDIFRLIKEAEGNFHKALQDDFNTPEALGIISALINKIQDKIFDFNKKEIKIIKKWLKDKFNLFRIKLTIAKIPGKIKVLVKRRQLLRINKQFIQADHLRKNIESLGYTVEDIPKGSFIWPKNNL